MLQHRLLLFLAYTKEQETKKKNLKLLSASQVARSGRKAVLRMDQAYGDSNFSSPNSIAPSEAKTPDYVRNKRGRRDAQSLLVGSTITDTPNRVPTSDAF